MILSHYTVSLKATFNVDYFHVWSDLPLQEVIRKSGLICTDLADGHQNNALVNTSRKFKATIQPLGWDTLPYITPYRLDLPICGFWLFSSLKDILRSKCLESRGELGVAVTKMLQVMSHDALLHVFRTMEQIYYSVVVT